MSEMITEDFVKELFGGHVDMDIGMSDFSLEYVNDGVSISFLADEGWFHTELPHIKTQDDFLNLCWYLIGPTWGAWGCAGIAREWLLRQKAKIKIYESKS